MWYILITGDGYFTGQYSDSRLSREGCISIHAELPPYDDGNKNKACKWVNDAWVFDEEKYMELTGYKTGEKTVEEQIQELVEERKEIKQRLDEHEEMLFTLVDVAMGGE